MPTHDCYWRAKELFQQALDLAPADREAFLRSACGEDQPLFLEVQELLTEHASELGDTLGPVSRITQAGSSIASARERAGEQPDAVIGPYKLLEVIGHGGMGIVYKAQREDIARVVALKLIKLGMDTQQVIARFESERQALAAMNHPNVAAVYDVGTTDSGRPYFVMEYIAGTPITTFCDDHQYTTRQRLGLFSEACQAIQHAHQKAIIHRDLKPGNILVAVVDGKPAVKVIDFGVAKATQHRLSEHSAFTETGQLVGTPEYMSPEQADLNAVDIDTRTDIYSLGVVLYELLAGALPFESKTLRSAAYAKIQAIIRDVDPPRPSTRLSSMVGDAAAQVAARRGTQPPMLHRELRGELDWIVMKCLEKERSQRYESAGGLALDVHRYLADEPVTAAAPSRVYRASKFMRRHRGPVIASVAVLVALICGIIGTTIGFFGQARLRVIAERERSEAERQEKEAREQSAIADAVRAFQSDMLASADPGKLLGDKVTVLQAVNAAVKVLDGGKLKDRPLVEAGVRDTIGNTLRDLGRHDLAEPNLRKALELRRSSLPPGARPIAQSMENLAVLLQWLRKYGECESMHREAIKIFAALDPPDEQNVATALNNLGYAASAQGKFAETEKNAREALAIYRRILPPDHSFIAVGLGNVATAMMMQGKFAEAEPVAREGLASVRKSLPAGHPNIGASLTTMRAVLEGQGKLAEAEPFAREADEIFRAALPADHPNRATTARSLGTILYMLNRLPEAEPLLREAVRILRKTRPDGDSGVIDCQRVLASVLSDQGKLAEADQLYREALQAAATDPNKVNQTALIRLGHGINLMRLKRFSESETELLSGARVLVGEPPDRLGGKVIEALISTYEAWDQAEPGAGHGASALQWRQRVASPATAAPPTTRE